MKVSKNRAPYVGCESAWKPSVRDIHVALDHRKVATRAFIHVEAGSVVPFVIGALAIILMLTATSIDIGYARERSIALADIAENVALSGALGVDTHAEVVGASEKTVVRLPLSLSAARESALQQLRTRARDWPSLTLVYVRIRDDAVRVGVCGRIVLPLAWNGRTKQLRRLCASAAAAMAVSSRQ